ncbi:sigma-70 family RNA polymerase sigma factor [Hyphobacterium sp. CCMP332]|uniref:RNA polymerase sigma factor n=1 Tax=Hyphobacterium sp. CCMP332 TaxID=2749086 RepID=UPI0016500291|nr:sigma-70 family RNA polymerase sigma factor [Hyphobacterium sp. CCMP332]QNL19795.1 sigma-70 family RNA polymerase sigma factor [Hyphobacterium sp. CCMP332]
MAQPTESRVFDELLLVRARQGDGRAAERLAIRWYPRLRRAARRILRDADLAEDAVQETWAGICSGWLGLSDPRRFPAWAYGILTRKCADSLRRIVRERERQSGQPVPAESGGGAPDARMGLNAAFASLPGDQRIAATLFFGEGLTLTEISAATSVPLGTVKSRLFHARQKLKAALSGSELP